uniref:Uncharacterized protein n=1 Tax=Aegilops tauschii subsp. strangulata TaxID=200361 RepID=A0A453QAV9_AEGTS
TRCGGRRACHVIAECAVVRRVQTPPEKSPSKITEKSCRPAAVRAHRVVELISVRSIHRAAAHPHLITHRFLPHPHSRSDPAPPPPCPADTDQSSGQRHSLPLPAPPSPPSAAMGSSHRHLMRLLDDPFFPFPPPPPTSSLSSSCPFL